MNKKVIINADDFGLTKSCTEAIFEAFDKKIITDTTMVANGSLDALELIMTAKRKGHPIFEHIGIHLNLTEGAPLTEEITKCKRLVDSNGFFCNQLFKPGNYLKKLTSVEIDAIYTEFRAQIEYFKMNDLPITHIDSHQHIHYNPQILKIVERISTESGINKIRAYKNVNIKKYYKRLYGDLINAYMKCKFTTTDWFGNAVEYDRLREGTSEIMVHPDYNIEGVLINRTRKINVGEAVVSDGNKLIDDLFFLKGDEYANDSYRYFEKRG